MGPASSIKGVSSQSEQETTMPAGKEEMVIIGGGPAGYTAAIYAARAGRNPLLLSGPQPGGQLMITSDVENYPGYADPVQGPWLMDQMREQAARVGVRIVDDIAVSVALSRRPFLLVLDGGDSMNCDTLVIATGAQARWLGLDSEKQFRGRGVSACATCDGFFFRGKRVAVVGGGNSAVEEALFLAQLAEAVTLIHRRGSLRAEQILQKQLRKHPRISVAWNAEITEILGNDSVGVNALWLRDTLTGEYSTLEVDGVFVAIGHVPSTTLFRGQVSMRAGGTIEVVPGSTTTSVPGVFAAGDVADDAFRQAITAAGLGCMAALEADRFLIRQGADQDLVPAWRSQNAASEIEE
jgi:thioredoxin reductase (NADPH)